MSPYVAIVDDDREVRTALEIALAPLAPIEVISFPDGKEALAWLCLYPTELRGVITDLHLPYVDGFEIIRTIRLERMWQTLPIVAVSADPDPEIVNRLVQLGASAFLVKPCSPARLLRILEELIYVQNKAANTSVPVDPDSRRPGQC